jgi:hypothetical protein
VKKRKEREKKRRQRKNIQGNCDGNDGKSGMVASHTWLGNVKEEEKNKRDGGGRP